MTTPRIYVADLAAYNSGVSHGRWIEVESVDQVQAEIDDILKTSPEPNILLQDFECACGKTFHIQVGTDAGNGSAVCPECDTIVRDQGTPEGKPYSSAEEWAVHDSEGFVVETGENPLIADLVELAELLKKHDGPFGAYLSHLGGIGELETAKTQFEEAYRGTYSSAADYAEELHQDIGTEIPKSLQGYIDWEALARDMELNSDILSIDAPNGQVYIFDGTL